MTPGHALDLLVDRAKSARSTGRAARASAAVARHRVMATVPSPGGAIVPVAARNGRICALDGDGTTLCSGATPVDKLIGYDWSDVPPAQKCTFCSVVLLSLRASAAHPKRSPGANSCAERARRAFTQAVAAERRAIQVHESAALMHQAVATWLDAAANVAPSSARAAGLGRRAHAERQLASDASERAEVVRRRLRAEGVDVGD